MTDDGILSRDATTLNVAERELTTLKRKIAELYINAARRCGALGAIDVDLVIAHLSSSAHLSKEEVVEFTQISTCLTAKESPLSTNLDLLISSGISIPALAKLSVVDSQAQAEAVRLLDAEIQLRADMVHNLRGNGSEWEKRESARRNALDAFALPQMNLRIAKLSGMATEIVEDLNEFDDYWADGSFLENEDLFHHCRLTLVGVAKKALSIFTSLFGDGDTLLQSETEDAQWLAAGYFALAQISSGGFGLVDALELSKDVGLGRLPLVQALSPLIAYDENWIDPPAKLTVVELCAGAGGMSLGLQAAGFEHVALIERYGKAGASLKANQPHWPVQLADVMKLTDEEVARYDDVDLLAAGLPCGPGEETGRKADLHPRIIEIISRTKPKSFILENDSGTRRKSARPLARSRSIEAIPPEDYVVYNFKLDTAEFGLPHSTIREFLVGIRKDIPRIFEKPRIMTRGVGRKGKRMTDWLEMESGYRRGVGAVLGKLMAPHETRNRAEMTDQQRIYNKWAEHWRAKYTMNLLPDIPEKQDRNAAGDKWESNGILGPWAIEDAPALDDVTGNDFIPRVTFQALAVAQGFPANWRFTDTENGRLAMIQSALPPVMARMVGLAVRSAITGETFDMDKEVKARVIEEELVGPQPVVERPKVALGGLRSRVRRTRSRDTVKLLPRDELYQKAVRAMNGEYINEVEPNHLKRGELKSMMELVQEEQDLLRQLDEEEAYDNAALWDHEGYADPAVTAG